MTSILRKTVLSLAIVGSILWFVSLLHADMITSTNLDRLVLGDANYGTDPNSASTPDITLENDEWIDGQTDDMIEFQGVGGSDNTDLRLDLDGTRPMFSSPTDSEIGLTGGFLITPTDTVPTATKGMLYFDDSENNLSYYSGAAWIDMTSGAANTLDQAYDQGGSGAGKAITADSGAVAISNTDADNAFLFTLDGTPSGAAALGGLQVTIGANSTQDALEFVNTGTGKDIDGSGSTWSITKAGVITGASIVNNGALTQSGVLTTAADVDMDAVGGSTADPDLSVDGYAKFGGTTEFTSTIAVQNSEQIDTSTDATFTYKRDTAGTVSFAGADNSGPADTTYDTTGAGAIVIGSADVTSVTISTDGTGDGEFALPAQTIGATEIVNDSVTFAQISDSSAIDADTTFTAADGISLTLTPSHTSGDWNFFTIDVDQIDDAAATDDLDVLRIDMVSASDDAGDTFDGIVLNWEDSAANATIDSALKIDNAETTVSTMTDAVIVTSSGVDGGVVNAFNASANNITNAISIGSNLILGGNTDTLSIGATDATVILDRNDAGAGTYTCTDDDVTAACIYDAGGAAGITIGSSDVTSVTVDSDTGLTFAENSESIVNSADGVIDLTRNTAGVVSVICSDDDATAGCTYDAGGAAPITIGSSDVTNVTIDSDVGLTFAENSESIVNSADAAFDFTRNTAGAVTLTSSDDDATADLTVDPGGNAVLTLGAAADTVTVAATTGLTLGNSESLNAGADAVFDFTRNDAGVVTLLCSDDDATAGCVYDAGGASPITIGSADVTAVTVTTDGVGDAEVALPENSIGPDELAVMSEKVIFCGQQANAGTIYTGPATAFLDGDYTTSYAMGSAGCDALDNAVEATADLPLGFANTSLKVLGMVCEVSSAGANGVALTLRSSAADITPSVTCTVPTGSTSCSTVTASTADVAANAPMAVKAVNTEDLSAQDYWCKVFVAWK